MILHTISEMLATFCWLSWEDTKDIKRSVERKGKVARVTADETGKTLA